MKKTLEFTKPTLLMAAVLVAGLALTASADAQTCVPAPPGLVGWWAGEGNANDSARTNNGVLHGGMSFVAGEAGQAFNFDGNSGYVEMPASASLNVGAGAGLTFECWIKPAALADAQQLVEWNNGAHAGLHLWISQPPPYGSGSGSIYVNLIDATGAFHTLCSGAGILNTNGFQHVALSYNKASGMTCLYYNGALVALGTLGSFTPQTSVDFYLGHRITGDPVGYFQGLMDEASLYNRALSAAEIQAIYNADGAGKCLNRGPSCGPPPAGLVNWWRGEGAAGDSAGTNNGTLHGGMSFAAGEVGQAFNFDGSSGYVNIPASAGFDVGSNGALTIEGWIKPAALAAAQAVAEWNSGGELGAHLWISQPPPFGGGVGSIYVNLVDTAGTFHPLTSAGGILITNGFQHVALTYDKVSGAACLYYNGGLVATQSLGGFTPQTSLGLYLGTRPGDASSLYHGLMDEVSLYSRALTAAEIQAIYNADGAGKCTQPTAPSIVVPPQSQAVNVGATAKFNVVAAGTEPLSYQWRFNGTNLDGATASSVGRSKAQLTDAGTYSVLVSNRVGTALSSNAVLTVTVPVCAPAASNLVGWWAGEGNANDNLGTNNGALHGGMSFVTGEVGQAFNFDGSSGYVTIPASASLNVGTNGGLTVEGWIKPASATANEVLAEWNSGGPLGVHLWISQPAPFGGGSGSIYVNLVDTTGAFHTLTTSGGLLNADGFQHVALTYDKTSGATCLYYNGALAASQSLGSFTPRTSLVLNLGERPGSASNRYHGLMDEVSLYSRALSAAEIQAIYNADSTGKCPLGVAPTILTQPTNQTVLAGSDATFIATATGTAPLRYQWRLSGTNIAGATGASLTLSNVQPAQAGIYTLRVTNVCGSATSSNAVLTVNQAPSCVTPPAGLVSWWRAEANALDQAGTNNGMFVGNTAYGAGRVGQAFVFDGSGDGVAVGNPTNLQLQNFTIEAWIRRANGSLASFGGEGAGHILGGSYGGYVFGLWDDGQLTLGKIGVSGVQSSQAITDTNSFHHVVVTKNGSTVVFYVDGVGETAAAYNPGFVFSGGFVVGARGGDYGASFLGSLDEVSIYNRELSAAEIQAIYSADSAGKCVNLVPPCATPPAGLVGWWRGEGAASDSAGTNNGVLEGGVAFAAGEVGQAFKFNGTNADVRVPASASLNVGLADGFTIETWINPADITQEHPVVEWNDGSFGVHLWVAAAVGAGPGSLWISAKDTSFNDHPLSTAAGLLVSNAWQHVAATYVRSNGSTVLYINGVARAQTILGAFTPRTIGDLCIGLRPHDAGAGERFVGLMDEVSLYNRALSAAEIAAIYNAGSAGKCPLVPSTNCAPPPAGLVSWWSAEGNPLDSADSNNGTLQGGATFTPGKVGQAFRFSPASGGTVFVPDAANLRLTNQLTIEAWINTLSTNEDRGIVSKVGFATGNNGYQIGLSGNSLLGQFNSPGLSWPAYQIMCPLPIATGVWHHVAWTYDQSAMKLYFNGQPVATNVIGAHPIATTTTDLRISGADDHVYFDGMIDEPAVYNRALSDAEIAAIYNAGSAGKCGLPPSILTQPQDQTVTAGANMIFTVAASGTPPLSYQWWLNNAAIAGATGTSLVLTNVQDSQGGIYRVVVSNPFGSLTSSKAALTVLSAPACVTPPAGSVSWWAAEGNALDSANSNNGALQGGATFAPGMVGQAFNFNPASGTVVVPDSSSLRLTNQLTIEGWINTRANTDPGGYAIVSKLSYPTGNNGYQFLVVGNTLQGLFNSPGTSWPSQRIISGPVISTGVWYHVAFTYDQSAIKLYCNGQLVTNKVIGAHAIAASISDLHISGVDSSHTYFDGLIDEVSIYGRALSANEIAAIYTAGSSGKCGLPPSILTQPQSLAAAVGSNITFTAAAAGTPPLSYQWRLNGTNIAGATGTSLTLNNVQPALAGNYTLRVTNAFSWTISSNAVLTVNQAPGCATPPAGLVGWWRGEGAAGDSAGTNFGVLEGSVAFTAGEVGQAFSFNGTNADVRVPASTSVNVGLADGFTIETWINPAEVSNGHPIVEWNSGSFGVNFWVAGDSPGSLWLSVKSTDSIEHPLSSAAGLLTTNVFQHVAATYDKTTGNAVLYLNGVVVAQQNLGSFTPMTTGDLYFGLRPYDGGAGTRFIGLVDEVSLYDRALSAGQIQVIYNAGSAGKCLTGTPPFIPAQPAEIGAIVPSGSASSTMRLEVRGAPSRVYVIQASTNVTDWVTIGLGVTDADGNVEFTDPNAANPPIRFYRAVGQ
jgi:hypothetical protein